VRRWILCWGWTVGVSNQLWAIDLSCTRFCQHQHLNECVPIQHFDVSDVVDKELNVSDPCPLNADFSFHSVIKIKLNLLFLKQWSREARLPKEWSCTLSHYASSVGVLAGVYWYRPTSMVYSSLYACKLVCLLWEAV